MRSGGGVVLYLELHLALELGLYLNLYLDYLACE